MSNEKKGINEIDDFAKALLDKKTEMALYKDINTLKEETMTEWERLQAEEKMSSALDMLRKDRGQKTIQEEEEEFDRKLALSQMVEEDDDDDDFTSEDLKKVSKPKIKVATETVEEPEEEEDDEEEVVVKERKPLFKKKEKKEKPSKKKKKDKKKMGTPLKIFLSLMVLGFLLMGGYAYKVFVYDPQNVVSEEQQAAYDRLIAYADEWDMMSDSEKLELLDMQEDYEILLDKQKTAINDYFKDKDHVGKSYNQTLKELKKLKESLEDESDENFQKLKVFLENWNGYTEGQRKTIVNYKTAYDGLNSILQKKIDDIARTNCSKSFNALYQEYQTTINKEEEERKKENEIKIQELTVQLNEEKNLLENYQIYAESLDADLAYAQSQGMDVYEINQQIYQNNQMIAQCQQTIASLEAQIEQLKQ